MTTGPDGPGGLPPGPPEDTDARDRELLAAHVAGDRDAFGTLVLHHRDRLWAVALRTLGDREEAADALQDALLSAYRAAGTYRGDAKVTTWLHRVVVNACLDRVRRRQARPTGTTRCPRGRPPSTSRARSPCSRSSSGRPSCWSTCTDCPWTRRPRCWPSPSGR